MRFLIQYEKEKIWATWRNSMRHQQGMERFFTFFNLWAHLGRLGGAMENERRRGYKQLAKGAGRQTSSCDAGEQDTHTHTCVCTHYISQQMPGDTSEFMSVTRWVNTLHSNCSTSPHLKIIPRHTWARLHSWLLTVNNEKTLKGCIGRFGFHCDMFHTYVRDSVQQCSTKTYRQCRWYHRWWNAHDRNKTEVKM